MSGQKGRDVLLKISDGEDEPTFITLAGIRTSTIELNAQTVDITSAESPDGWRELLGGAGVKSARIAGSGVFKDAASDVRMRAVFFDGLLATWQLILPGLGRLTGPFQITQLNWGGTYGAEATFSVELQNAGSVQSEAET